MNSCAGCGEEFHSMRGLSVHRGGRCGRSAATPGNTQLPPSKQMRRMEKACAASKNDHADAESEHSALDDVLESAASGGPMLSESDEEALQHHQQADSIIGAPIFGLAGQPPTRSALMIADLIFGKSNLSAGLSDQLLEMINDPSFEPAECPKNFRALASQLDEGWLAHPQVGMPKFRALEVVCSISARKFTFWLRDAVGCSHNIFSRFSLQKFLERSCILLDDDGERYGTKVNEYIAVPALPDTHQFNMR
jgi:hypothetical protein